MKNSKTDAEDKKATAPKGAKAKGADINDATSATNAKKLEITKKTKPVKKT